MSRISQIIFLDILKNRIVLFYTALLSVLSWSAFSLEDNTAKGLLTLLNVILLTVPLVAVIFSTIYIYNSGEFIELLLSQPVKRSAIWRSLFTGLGLSLVLAFLAGAGIPVMVYSPDMVGLIMLTVGVAITLVFVALAFLSSIMARDKAKGIGISIMLWLFFALLFDGIVLFLMFQFSDYPIEKAMVVVAAFNPIDLARILILLHLDLSAMLGYTGAIFRDFFGTTTGMLIALALLLSWIIVPFMLSARRFSRKDL
jgi:Cu-processing system permease protein